MSLRGLYLEGLMSAAAYGNVGLQECKNSEFEWELKQVFVKAAAYGSVH